MRGVDALDVVRRIGFGEPAALRFGERAVVRRAREHLAQDEVRRAVDARRRLRGSLRRRAARRSSARSESRRRRRLRRRSRRGAARERSQFGAAGRQQFFVGGDDVLAVLERAHDQFGGDADPADALDDHVDVVARRPAGTGRPVSRRGGSSDRARLVDALARRWPSSTNPTPLRAVIRRRNEAADSRRHCRRFRTREGRSGADCVRALMRSACAC